MSKSENNSPSHRNSQKKKPLVVDQVLELVVYVHLQAKESSAPFDFPHFPSAWVQGDNLRCSNEIQKPNGGHKSIRSLPGNQTSAEASPECLHLL